MGKKQAYPKNNLYKAYKDRLVDVRNSSAIPNVTTKITLEFINYALNLSPSWSCCMDIGGGNGHYANALASRFKKTILIEIEELPEHKLLSKNIDVVHSFIENYTTNTKADFILLADVFEHIKDIRTLVCKLSSFQNIGGIMYIITPNATTCGPANESGLHYSIHTNGHVKQYHCSEIITIMKEYGYELMFKVYDEGNFRKFAKHIIYGLARRDQLYKVHLLYMPIRPIVLLFSSFLLFFLEKIVYHFEKKNITNEFGTITQNLAFKKSYDA